MSLNISASLLKDFITCQKRAYYRLYEPSESVSSEDGAVGSVVHAIIEKYWDCEDAAINSASFFLKRESLDPNLVSKVATFVSGYFELFSQDTFSNEDSVEQYFKLPYKPGIYLTGKMDRVTTEGYIYDWKTSKNLPRDINTDPQFILYYLAYKLLYNKEPKGVVYVSLPHRQIIWFEPVKSIIDNFEDRIIPECISVIQSKNFKRNGLNKKNACSYCQFKEICWKEGNIQ